LFAIATHIQQHLPALNLAALAKRRVISLRQLTTTIQDVIRCHHELDLIDHHRM